jgi:hypothetical protein
MKKKTRNTLLFLGIVFSIVIIGLRLEYQFGAAAQELGAFSELLGYEEDKNYAVLVFDREREPLLFLATVSEGKVNLISVMPAAGVMEGLPKSDFTKTAESLIERVVASRVLTTVNVVAFMTSDAAGRLTDALGGLSMGDAKIDSNNLASAVWGAAYGEGAEERLADMLSFPKQKLVTRSKALLIAGKDIFSQKMAAAYIKNGSLFGESCLGACEAQMFEYFGSSVSLER